MKTSNFLTTQPSTPADPVTIVIPIRWMHKFRRRLGDNVFRILMAMSFDPTALDVDWGEYGVQGSISSASHADVRVQEAWLEALNDNIVDGLGEGEIEVDWNTIQNELIPAAVLNGWDTAIGSSEHETWIQMLDGILADQLVIFTTFDNLSNAREVLVDADGSIKFEELVNDAYGYRGSWNSVYGEELLTKSKYLPSGWYQMGYYSMLGGSHQSINYDKLKI